MRYCKNRCQCERLCTQQYAHEGDCQCEANHTYKCGQSGSARMSVFETARVRKARSELAEALKEQDALQVLQQELYTIIGYTPGGSVTLEVQYKCAQIEQIIHELIHGD